MVALTEDRVHGKGRFVPQMRRTLLRRAITLRAPSRTSPRPWSLTPVEPGPDVEEFMLADIDRDAEQWETGAAERFSRMYGAHKIRLMIADLSRNNVLHLRGLPCDPVLPPTPYGPDPDPASLKLMLAGLLGAAAAMKMKVFAFAVENGGRLIRHVCPKHTARIEASSQGWAKELLWHVDGAYRDIGGGPLAACAPAPRFLCWSVVYATPAVPITFIKLSDLIARLHSETIGQLLAPQFIVGVPDSFDDDVGSRLLPILLPDGRGRFFSRYNQSLVRGVNASARAALQCVAEVLQDDSLVRRVEISPGDVIMLDNWRTLHMRPEFEPQWDGKDRWLLRVYATADKRLPAPACADFPRCWR
jgi:hypothetical protein